MLLLLLMARLLEDLIFVVRLRFCTLRLDCERRAPRAGCLPPPEAEPPPPRERLRSWWALWPAKSPVRSWSRSPYLSKVLLCVALPSTPPVSLAPELWPGVAARTKPVGLR